MDYPLAFRDMEYSGFCGLVDAGRYWWMLVGSSGKWIILLPLGIWNIVDASGEQWKVDYPLAFRDIEYSGFCGLVDAGGY